ncbi:N-6 DNA methylase [Myxococcus sp. 1LA]
MTLASFDKYYTPIDVAERLAAAFSRRQVSVVIDPACGDGRLLDAIAKVFPKACLLGIDVDKTAIRKLRRNRPLWVVSRANMLSRRSRQRSAAHLAATDCDLVVANPPFSMGFTKGHIFRHQTGSFRTSLAMRYLLESIESFNPRVGFAAILPESAAYSQLDATARAYLGRHFEWAETERLPRTAFSGTRARAILVVGWRREEIRPALRSVPRRTPNEPRHERLVRGGLPRHEAKKLKNGVPFLHTTSLGSLASGVRLSLPQVHPIKRGLVLGPAVVFPRVGEVSRNQIAIVPSDLYVQLSDCVMAIRAKSHVDAQSIRETILTHWAEFSSLFKGTGARYVTVARMNTWIEKNIPPQ